MSCFTPFSHLQILVVIIPMRLRRNIVAKFYLKCTCMVTLSHISWYVIILEPRGLPRSGFTTYLTLADYGCYHTQCGPIIKYHLKWLWIVKTSLIVKHNSSNNTLAYVADFGSHLQIMVVITSIINILYKVMKIGL